MIEDPTNETRPIHHDNDRVVHSKRKNVENIGNPISKRCFLDDSRGCHSNKPASYEQRDLDRDMGVVHGIEDRRIGICDSVPREFN